MRRGGAILLSALVALAPVAASSPPPPVTAATAPKASDLPKSPSELFGDLFRQVQMRQIFSDGKTFADAVPKQPAADIMAAYDKGDFRKDADLRRFVLRHFDVPSDAPLPVATTVQATPHLTLSKHIDALWPHLTRNALKPQPGSSALALPWPYVVPGGRFRELYYWDSYFTMLGLKAGEHDDLIEGMIGNFVSLVDRYGHVPNGTRTYYLHRSQPPVLYLMMGLSRRTNERILNNRRFALQREHDWWMQSSHIVTMPDGSILNRYAGGADRPRDESYREDVLTARKSRRPAAEVYRDLRAAAESGWDFSSRWFADGKSLSTIDTMNIVSVDLNSLLYGMERDIAEGCRAHGFSDCAEKYDAMATKRRAAVERWLWDEKLGRYGDWDVQRHALRTGVTAATAYPLFTGLASQAHANRVAATIRRDLLAPGGLRTSRVDTGQQWDKPNGWPPLQWIAVEGLRKSGHPALAKTIATRFLKTVERTYRAQGKLVEKYDVEQARPGGGGEYPLQDGFGWTNGVTAALIARYGAP